jgi:SAM-dependent methyltransferase
VQWVYAAGSREELARRYDEWAKDYDTDLERDFEYTGHIRGAEVLARYVPPSAKIIDVGCGTGLAAVELARRGFQRIDGFDLSEGMLAEARGQGVYQDLRPAILGEPLDYPTGAYDAAIATGVFSVGHAPASGWDEVARMVKPGGYFVLTLRPDIFESNGFKAKEEELASSGKWELVEAAEPEQLLAKGEPGIFHQIRVYRIVK